MERKFNKKELICDSILFMGSCLNTNIIYVFLFAAFLKIREGSVGFLKMNLLFLLRQCFYLPGMSTITSTQSTIKLGLLTVSAVYILIVYLVKHTAKIPVYITSIFLFGVLATASAVLWGSFPVAGMIKTVSFTLVFLSTVLAVADCWKYFNFETYVYRYLNAVVLISCLLIPFDAAYMQGSSAMLFRGIWNHPNDFGIICAIFLAMTMVKCEKIEWKQVAQIVLVFVLIFLSGSRGAMIASIGTMIIYVILCRNKSDKKILFSLLGITFVLLLVTPLDDALLRFFSKNSGVFKISTDMFKSRDEIYEAAMRRLESNPLFGRGLLIPYIPGYISRSMNAGRIEPGNIFWEVLGGTGVLGLVAFLALLLVFFSLSEGKKRLYAVVAVLTSISEVSFFSVNNYAFIYYAIIAMSVISADRVVASPEQEHRKLNHIRSGY